MIGKLMAIKINHTDFDDDGYNRLCSDEIHTILDIVGKEIAIAVEARTEELSDWLQHKPECILSQWSAGEPTKDGGYRSKYAGKWYETRPADKTPKCNCGLSDALTTLQKEEK